MITRLANLRSKYLGMAYGDQAFFVKNNIFEEMNGFAKLPICEDIDFFKRLRNLGPVVDVRANAPGKVDKGEINVQKEIQGQILSKGTLSIVGLPDEYK